MSAVDRTRARSPVEVAPSAVRLVDITWTVSRLALKDFGADGPDVELHWRIDLELGKGEVYFLDTVKGARVLLGECSGSRVEDGELVHVEGRMGADLLVATVRDGRVLFARTTVLARLAIAGGRYEVCERA